MNDRNVNDVMLESKTIMRDFVVVFLFGFWLLIPGIGQLCGYGSVDDIPTIEFREPAADPSVPESFGEWQDLSSNIESYLNDHFGFRFQMGVLQSSLLAGIGTSSSDQVFVGKDGWLFFTRGNLLDEFRGTLPLSQEKIESWVEGVGEVRATLDKMRIENVVTIIPSKWSVYPEHLPKWARPQAPTRYSILADRMENGATRFIDARALIMPEKAEGEERLFRMTDTHWTTRAAFMCYQRTMTVLLERRPGLIPLFSAELKIETVGPRGPGDLHRFLHSTPVLGEPPWAAYRIAPGHHRHHTAKAISGNKWTETPVADALGTVWGTAYSSDAANEESVLVYGDSFTIPMLSFLINTFSEVVMVRHRMGVLDSDFIRVVNPQIVLINLNEKALRYPLRFVSKSPDLEELQW